MAMVVNLRVVVLILDVYPLRRLGGRIGRSGVPAGRVYVWYDAFRRLAPEAAAQAVDALVLALTAVVLALRRPGPGLPAAWVAYVVVLLPVLGILQSGPQIAADRYTYLAGLGWASLAGAGLLSCWRTKRFLIPGCAVCVVVGLGVLTWNQVQIWHDSERLWTHVLAIDPQSSIAENNLGIVRADRKKRAEAIEHYQRA